jgi:hypothetical protein
MRAMERVSGGWAEATRVDAARLLGFCLLFWAAKGLGERVSGVPGHAVALWIPVLMAAQVGVGRPGVAALVALGGSWLAGLPVPSPLSLAGHVSGGVVLALLGGRRPSLRLAIGFGMLAAAVKFGTRWLPVATLGMPAHFLAIGSMPTLLSHLAFGALGGALGWLLCRRRAE